MLKQLFEETAAGFQAKPDQIHMAWADIETAYSAEERYYHTLHHLEQIFAELKPVKHLVADWPALVFSAFFHDLVYDTSENLLHQNNEVRSAELAEQKLSAMRVDEETIAKCKAQILSTRHHDYSGDNDTNLLNDADMSILGQSPEQYAKYRLGIKKEFESYPQQMFVKGRKKFLEHFLGKQRLFHTDYFFTRYEQPARKNISAELAYYANGS